MATAKKTTAKKAPVKKTVAKKAPAKKPVAKKSSAKKTTAAKQAQIQSFKASPETGKFTDFKITRQTVYWVILISFIVFVQLWIIKIQLDVVSLIEQQEASLIELQ